MVDQRERWTSRLGFILAAAGSAIGLGNLWKFPFITWDNEGGAFVYVYLVAIAIVGMPIMIAEVLIGRRTQKSPVGALREAFGRRWSWVGGLGVVTGFILLSYYLIIAGWTLRYFVKCMDWSLDGFDASADLGAGFGAFVAQGGIQILLAVIFMTATVWVVYRGIGRGIERVARVLMPTLLGILLLLLVSALSMEGAGEALSFIFKPDFSRLEPAGWLEALGHSFFTLSLGMGAMITYGSYLKRRESVVSAGAVVVVLDTVIAFIATVIMFSVIFSVPGMTEQVGKSTVGMLFITLPQLFYTVVPFGQVLAPLFYVLVAFAALTSTISLLEVVSSYLMDEKKMPRRQAVMICGGVILVVSALCGLSFGAWAPISTFVVIPGKPGLFSLLDHLVSNWFLPVGGFFITFGTGWLMSREETFAELIDERTPGWFHYGVWRVFIRYVAPLAVAGIIVAVIAGKDFS